MKNAVNASMLNRTGKTTEQWVDLVKQSGLDLSDQNAVRKWLKSEHSIPQNSQWAIAEAAALGAGWTPPTLEQQIDAQYTGKKAQFRETFAQLRDVIMQLGDDVSVEGRAGYIPFSRKRQFVAIAVTQNRLDLGLRFTDAPDSPLLQPCSAPGQSTHKICIRAGEKIHIDITKLIQLAYSQNG
ncbi:DUF4287 domain-containing protein [Neptunicella marina]|uniref:DUF4287 domain-containing protein n=2 Tax=Neptunicella marina TaxID=2125989 RepID=A0A8J6M356_9ALTE|nr:DUF4287 domain-containing protein [Neptunicella marina]